jgi:hypothetical protein
MIGVWESVDMCAPTSIMAETIPLHSGIENAGPRGAPTLIPSFELFIIGTMTFQRKDGTKIGNRVIIHCRRRCHTAAAAAAANAATTAA